MPSIETSQVNAEKLLELESQLAKLSRAQERRANTLTIIAFSGDMDKLIAAFTLATGAAAMGIEVAMYFTFWAITALKRRAIFEKKGTVEKLLTAMLPCGPEQVALSKMNLCGLGRWFFRIVMRRRHIETLPNLIALAQQMNVRMIACQTAMEIMAVTRAELVEGVECGGVARCLDLALNSGSTVFI